MRAATRTPWLAAAAAFADRLFLLLGDAVTLGLPVEPLFHEVARSNLTKLRGVKTGHDKGAKGPGYEPPRIQEIIEERLRKAEES